MTMNMNTHAALSQYRKVQVEGDVGAASSHRLVALLLEGAMSNLLVAENAARQEEIARRGEAVSKVIAIIDNLRASLDDDKGGDIAGNLRSLYDYMETRLVESNLKVDPEGFREVRELIREISTAWAQIPGQGAE